MRILYKILSLALFILLMGFAVKNAYPVTLLYYLGISWQAPLSLILFIALLTGIVAGLIAITPTLIKQRRELNSLRKQITASSHQGAQ
ncbi:LapA family protein [Candidatus Methylopumilus turicensis]|jgi:uncharacterized integral membrane protein|nr:LapA family protein [Candidatus Methylopumilus turicensis]